MVWWALLACASDDDPTMTIEETAADTGEAETAGGTEVPTDGDLMAWIDGGEYLTWPAEAEIHPSAGPHFGDVRSFFSPALAASLEAGNAQHPVGSASVKELYGNGNEIGGYAIMVRVGSGAGNNAWYWYEVFNNQTFADGRGESICTGCHSDGVDFVLSAGPD